MTSDYDKVLDFHQAFGISISQEPSIEILRNNQRVLLRFKLIREEYEEFCRAFQNMDLIEMIDALADLLYVIYGTCVSFGYKVKIDYQFHQQRCLVDYHSQYCKNSCQEYIQQMKMKIAIFEEVVNNLYLSQIGDTLYQMLWITYQCADSVLCIDISKAFNIVHQSNMTKLCTTEQDAIETVNWYLLHEKDRYKAPSYRKSVDGQHWVIYDHSSGKILKNIRYSPPDLSELLNVFQFR